jgi:hypothetical protein
MKYAVEMALRCHDIRTKFHKVDGRGHGGTKTAW